MVEQIDGLLLLCFYLYFIFLDDCDAHLAESLFKHALGILHLILDLRKQR